MMWEERNSRNKATKRKRLTAFVAPSSSELAELVVYCKERKAPLDEAQVINGKINTRLRQFKQTGLLKMINRLNCLDYTSVTSTEIGSMIQMPLNIETVIQFHLNILSKVYPGTAITGTWGRRDPKPMWLAGTQIASVQFQDPHNPHISTNNAMFASNGGCGYVLKPNVLLTGPETTCILTLKIVEARHLRSFKFINEQLFEPHIRVSSCLTKCCKQQDKVYCA